MKELLEESVSYFYMDLISIFCALIASIIGVIMRKKYMALRFMFLYPLASFLQTSVTYFLDFILKVDTSFSTHFSIIIFLLVEFFSLYIYYYKIIKNSSFRKILITVFIIYLSLFIFKWGENGFKLFMPAIFYFIQSIMVLSLAIIYLFFLFIDKPKSNLLNEPSFWITIGALLYFLCTVPIYIAAKYVLGTDGFAMDKGLFSINYICYSLFFILLIRAYLCKVTAKP